MEVGGWQILQISVELREAKDFSSTTLESCLEILILADARTFLGAQQEAKT